MNKIIRIVLVVLAIISLIIFWSTQESQLPEIQISTESGFQVGSPFSYCWNRVCLDGIPIISDEKEALIVRRGELIMFNIKSSKIPDSITVIVQNPVRRFEDWPNDPSSITKEKISLEPNSEGSFSLSVEPGVYSLSFSGDWKNGDSSSVFKIEIQ